MSAGSGTHNEDYSATCFRRLRSRRASTAGCLRWPTESAGTTRAKWLRSRRGDHAGGISRSAARASRSAACCRRLVQTANTRVYDADAGIEWRGMATTLVACALRYDRAVVAHVGDSRCYLIRERAATLLTRDHTVANEQVRLGLLSADEAREADTRHVLSRSLGTELFVNVEINDHQVFPGDVLLLCSDGLHGAVAAAEIADRGEPKRRIWTRPRAGWWSLPTNGTAAIMSAFS